MLEFILKSLSKTSKGNLQYDRAWMREGRANDILQSVASLTKIHTSPIPDKLESEIPIKDPLNEQKKDIDSSDSPDSSNSITPTPPEYPNPLQDTCCRILDYEDQRRLRVQDAIQSRKWEMETMEIQSVQDIEEQMELRRQGWELEFQRKEEQIVQMHIQHLLEVKEQQSKLKEHQNTHAKRLHEKMREMEERQRQIEEQQVRRKREQEHWQQQLLAYHSQLEQTATNVVEVLSSCLRPDLLQLEPRQHLQTILDAQSTLHQLALSLSNIAQTLTLEDMQQAQILLLGAKVSLSNVQADVAQANAKFRDQEIKPEPQSTDIKKQELSTMTGLEAIKQVSQATVDTRTTTSIKTKDLGILSGCVHPESFELYQRLMAENKKWEDSFEQLETDDQMKKLRFEFKKAVNTPVNAISSQSGRQLRDKLDRLIGLLGGAVTTGPGGRSGIGCTSHPQGTHFCSHLLAKKIVSQAESVVSSHQEAAFPLAAVTVGLWGRYPKFGELLLAQLYLKCPYLLPFYHPRKKGQEEKDYFKLLGYNFDESGEMEQQDKYLKRMSGIVCFYAALLQTNAPPGYVASHPHGVQHGWQFLSQLVNLRPRFDITATVLFHFLEVAGNALYKVYGKQMQKLIQVLRTDYMRDIEKASAGESGGPLSRLELFLSSAVKNGRINPPEGLLPTGFWNTFVL